MLSGLNPLLRLSFLFFTAYEFFICFRHFYRFCYFVKSVVARTFTLWKPGVKIKGSAIIGYSGM